MRLYLCRHAEAIDGAPGLADEDRWLTARGRVQARTMGESLRGWGEVPTVWLASPLVRAVQTADGLAQALEFAGQISITRALAPEGTLGRLLSELELLAGDDDAVAAIGHEPQMGEWAAQLGGRHPRPFERMAVMRLDFPRGPTPIGGRAVFYASPGGGRVVF